MHQIGNMDTNHICHGYSVLLTVANVSAYLYVTAIMVLSMRLLAKWLNNKNYHGLV